MFEKAANAFEPKLPLHNITSTKTEKAVTLAHPYCYCRRPAMNSNRSELISLALGSEVTWDLGGRCANVSERHI
jgi:hypothetical protein